MRNQDDNYQNGASADDERISQLLASLPRVDAPGGFGFRVRARIASRRQTDGRRSWLPVTAAVAAPLGLVLAVGGYFGLTSFYMPATVSPPAVSDLRPADLPAEEVSHPTIATAPSVAIAMSTGAEPSTGGVRSQEVRSVDISDAKMKRTNSVRPPSTRPGGGSFEITSGIPRVVNVSLAAKDVLADIGVDANLSGSSWTVGSVRQNSAAARSGLKPGDVIEAVNGRALSGNTSFEGKFTGKSVRVRRDGKSIQIALKP